MKTATISIVTSFMLLSTPAIALKKCSEPTLGLALSGGNARAISAIGAFQAFKENGLFFKNVTGVSGGAVAAAFYANGFHPNEMREIIFAADFSKLFDWKALETGLIDSVFGNGLMKGEKLRKFIYQHLIIKDLHKMNSNVGLLSVDIDSGTPALFTYGDAATAVMASSAVPGMFEPRVIKGRRYVDGAVTGAQIAVKPLRGGKMRSDIVVALDFTRTPKSYAGNNVASITWQAFAVQARLGNAKELKDADVTIEPKLNWQGNLDTSRSDKIRSMQAGYDATITVMPELLRKIADWKKKHNKVNCANPFNQA